MEKDKIVKALECCVKTQSICDCWDMGCPALTKQGCQFYLRTDEDYEGVIFVELIKEALSLIRDQEKRIKEIETSCTELTRNLHACKADTVRKMQGMLKAEAITVQDHTGKLGLVILADDVDKIANQLLEETT